MRRRRRCALEAFAAALGLTFASAASVGAHVAEAQTEPETPQSGSSLPSGASGAMVVPPKDQPATPAPKQPVLVPPVITKDPGAVYPQRAIVDAVAEPVTVVVIVDVDREGHVKSTRVDAPQGHGFDEAALEAASGLVFTPATKDGVPVPARVKHAYAFTPPAARLVGRVFEAGGGPLSGAQVTVRRVRLGETFEERERVGVHSTHGARDRGEVVTTGPDGRWSVEGSPAARTT